MKFEKFLKAVGTHGAVVEVNDSQKWLVCDGVGMVIPMGVDNLLSSNKNPSSDIVNAISKMELDDRLTLVDALLSDPAGNASSIYRVFEDDLGDKIVINNKSYGLLEKSDLLGYGEIEDDEERITKYILVYDRALNIIGFITGSDEF